MKGNTSAHRKPAQKTIRSPLYESEPWPVRIEERLSQLFTRVAALEADWQRFRKDAETINDVATKLREKGGR